MEISELIKKSQDLEKNDFWERDAAQINKDIIKISKDNHIRNAAYKRLAQCYLRHGFLKEAISYLEQGSGDGIQEIQHLLIGCREIQKELTDQQKKLRQVNIELLYEQQNYRALIKYGKIFKIQQMYDGAIEAYTKASQLDPRNSVAYTGLGALYVKKGLLNEAREAYNKALELSPGDPIVLRGISGLLSMEGKGDLAKTLWKKKGLK